MMFAGRVALLVGLCALKFNWIFTLYLFETTANAAFVMSVLSLILNPLLNEFELSWKVYLIIEH